MSYLCCPFRDKRIIPHTVHNSPRYSEQRTPLFGLSIVAVVMLIITGCLAIREELVTEVSVEIGKPISLLSNRAPGPVFARLNSDESAPRRDWLRVTPVPHPQHSLRHASRNRTVSLRSHSYSDSPRGVKSVVLLWLRSHWTQTGLGFVS